MNNTQVSALLAACLIPGIADDLGIADDNLVEFLDKFYRSALYGALKEEDTAVWHLSSTTLANLYLEEQETGILYMPEDQ
ncbi:MAG: hypothetical protein LBB74_07935 [Chitinispirillales bacterium]|jgi:hypothetical protein|nr:hypothetical protein [Chitinispirillales bacterium]